MAKKIKFQFGELEYQKVAVQSVVNLLKGVERKQDGIYKTKRTKELYENDPVRNESLIPSTRLHENLRNVQLENNLFASETLKQNDYNFTIEMETGTGKTYVYLQTILELNKKYGIKKFMIVVPSVAIRKGIEKSIEQLSPHFKRLDYQDLNLHSMIYDSKHLSAMQSGFVERDDLSICIINIQAFNKTSNKIREEDEYGRILWSDIAYVRPVVIIDEPQKIEGQKGKKSQSLKALDDLNPLFTLRYSATHKNHYHPIFKLDSYQAYEKNLVKKIQVKTVNSLFGKEMPYIRYLSFTTECKAKIEIFYKQQGKKTKFRTFHVGANASLEELSGGLAQYKDMHILDEPHKLKPLRIATGVDGEDILLEQGECNLKLDDNTAIRYQIRLSIENHFEKQLSILEKGQEIKGITLFFVDSVAHVRDLTASDGRGAFLKIFDEEYLKYIQKHEKKLKKYEKYFPDYQDVLKLREGYFACDKKNNAVEISDWAFDKDDSTLTAKSQEEIDRGISLILERKDELISFEEPLAFIFSHSALREGWDNPNVFTLCTLKQGSSDIAKKQEIGRGLRLPVDIKGQRCEDTSTNVLTVIANDSYDNFSKLLQKDFNTSMNFDKEEVTSDILSGTLHTAGIPAEKITSDLMDALKQELVKQKIIDKKFKLHDNKEELKERLDNLSFQHPTLNEHKVMIVQNFVALMNEKGGKRIDIINGDNPPIYNGVRAFVTEEEFRIAYETLCETLLSRTVYRCNIDNEAFIEESIVEINEYLKNYKKIRQVEVTVGTAGFNQGKGFEVSKGSSQILEDNDSFTSSPKSDFHIVNDIMFHTMLPRLALFLILKGVEDREALNAQDVVDNVIQLLLRKLKLVESQKIFKYEVIDGYKLNENKIFGVDTIEDEEDDKLGKAWRIFESDGSKKKAINMFYKMDSEGEFKFAKKLEEDESVIMFTKLKKGGFIIDTPQGNYSPDWAVVCNEEQENGTAIAVYFVVESKFDKLLEDLTQKEQWKIDCGRLHFKAVSEVVKFDWVNSYEDFQKKFHVNGR